MPAAEALRLGALNSIHALRWLRHAVVTVWAWLWGSVLYLTKHKGSKLELIQRDVQELQKLPVHLALLVNERQISHSDLARLVNWCFCAGINYVSLYDPRGSLRDNVEALHSAVKQQHQSLFSAESEPLILTSSDNYQESPHSNGVHSVLVVGPRDGREQLTQVARSLCTQVQQHCMATKDVDTSLIHNRLYIGSNGGFPEPSLVVVVGGPPSLLGYLPWHIRLSEIVFIGSHHKISYQQFLSLLHCYACTTQRFGK